MSWKSRIIVVFGVVTVVTFFFLFSGKQESAIEDESPLISHKEAILSEDTNSSSSTNQIPGSSAHELPTYSHNATTSDSATATNNFSNVDSSELAISAKPGVGSIESNEFNINQALKDGTVNQETLSLAQSLRNRFEDSTNDLNYHNLLVEEYLRSEMVDEVEIAEFMAFYQSYIEHEYAKLGDQEPLWADTPETPEEALELNQLKQQHRRDLFGEDAADTLWGENTDKSTLNLRRQQILNDESIDPEEKARLLEELSVSAKNDKTTKQSRQDTAFYNQMAIYGEELLKLSNEEREIKIKEIRDKIYNTD